MPYIPKSSLKLRICLLGYSDWLDIWSYLLKNTILNADYIMVWKKNFLRAYRNE